jgi:hypothetical protein
MLMMARTARLRKGIITGPDATIFGLQAIWDTNSLSTYSFSATDLGPAAADKYIAMCLMFNNGSSINSIASVIVGSQTCGRLVAQNGTNVGSEIWITDAAFPGTSATIVVTTAGAAFTRVVCVTYRLNFLQSPSPQFSNHSSSGYPYSMSLGISAGGVGIGCCYTRNANTGGGTTWGGFSEDIDLLLGPTVDSYTSARTVSATSGTGTVTISSSAPGDVSAACCASLR